MAVPWRKLWDLMLVRVALLEVVLYASMAFSVLSPVQWIAGTILVLLLPGYAWVTVVFPTRTLSPIYLAILYVGVSLSFAVVCGLLLNLIPWGLTPTTWKLALGVVAYVGAVLVTLRQLRGSAVQTPSTMPALRRIALTKIQISMLISALVVTIVAGAVAYSSATSAVAAQQVVQFWMAPSKIKAGTSTQVHIGMSEYGPALHTTFYAVIVINGQTIEHTRPFSVKAGHNWNESISIPALPPDTLVEADLYRSDAPNQAYRSVWVWTTA